MGQFVQSHAMHFFHLAAPDLLLGMDSDPAQRNILGVLEKHPDIARDGIALRKFGQQVIERWHGLKFERPLKRMREVVEVTRRLLAMERVTFETTWRSQ